MKHKNDRLMISFCIPTNGVIEWVFPVLDSIYHSDISEDVFEVIVTDNGSNEKFYKQMTAYGKKHSNIIYEKTASCSFLNEIDAYQKANAPFIKFLNHRTVLLPGALEAYIEFVKEHIHTKPAVYFANGVLKNSPPFIACKNFDEFVRNLSYWSSWSTGMGFWKDDFDKIDPNIVYNELFPHTTILFHERKKEAYFIDNRTLLHELPTGTTPKGNYDLFYAFAVEYPAILCELRRSCDITSETFLAVKKENLSFIMDLYITYVIKKQACSYDLSSYDHSIEIFYSHRDASKCILRIIGNRIKQRIGFGCE